MWYTQQCRAYSSAAERAAHNRLVAGSNPAGPTTTDFQDREPGMDVTMDVTEYVAG